MGFWGIAAGNGIAYDNRVLWVGFGCLAGGVGDVDVLWGADGGLVRGLRL